MTCWNASLALWLALVKNAGRYQTFGKNACHPERELWIWLDGRRDPSLRSGQALRASAHRYKLREGPLTGSLLSKLLRSDAGG
jgi:hypothetical protein